MCLGLLGLLYNFLSPGATEYVIFMRAKHRYNTIKYQSYVNIAYSSIYQITPNFL